MGSKHLNLSNKKGFCSTYSKALTPAGGGLYLSNQTPAGDGWEIELNVKQ
jgi:hypothetical protein